MDWLLRSPEVQVGCPPSLACAVARQRSAPPGGGGAGRVENLRSAEGDSLEVRRGRGRRVGGPSRRPGRRTERHFLFLPHFFFLHLHFLLFVVFLLLFPLHFLSLTSSSSALSTSTCSRSFLGRLDLSPHPASLLCSPRSLASGAGSVLIRAALSCGLAAPGTRLRNLDRRRKTAWGLGACRTLTVEQNDTVLEWLDTTWVHSYG